MLALVVPGGTPVVVGDGMIRLEPDRLIVISDGAVMPALVIVGVAALKKFLCFCFFLPLPLATGRFFLARGFFSRMQFIDAKTGIVAIDRPCIAVPEGCQPANMT